jgi:hypothetical protein
MGNEKHGAQRGADGKGRHLVIPPGNSFRRMHDPHACCEPRRPGLAKVCEMYGTFARRRFPGNSPLPGEEENWSIYSYKTRSYSYHKEMMRMRGVRLHVACKHANFCKLPWKISRRSFP